MLCYLKVIFGLEYPGIQYGATVFHDRINQNLLVAFAAYLFAIKALDESNKRIVMILMVALSFGTFCFVGGRTGYLVLTVLIVFLIWTRLRKARIITSVVVLSGLFGLAYFFCDVFRQRLEDTFVEVENPATKRLGMYKCSWELYLKRPILGWGTGSFQVTANKNCILPEGRDWPRQPHNTYLYLLVQIGIPGIVLFLMLLIAMWWESNLAPPFYSQVGKAIILTIASGCLFNSLLSSVTSGYFFAYMGAVVFSAVALKTGRDPGMENPKIDSKNAEKLHFRTVTIYD
jgi:O-antigen ligase